MQRNLRNWLLGIYNWTKLLSPIIFVAVIIYEIGTNNFLTVIAIFATVISGVSFVRGCWFGFFPWSWFANINVVLTLAGIVGKSIGGYTIGVLIFSLFWYLVFVFMIFSLLFQLITNKFNGFEKLLTTILPEEYVAEFNALEQRWKKQQFSNQVIVWKRCKCILGLFWGYVQSQIENLWLEDNNVDFD